MVGNLVSLSCGVIFDSYDAKQRQVALDIQIIDFDMDNDFVASNTSFIRTGNNKYIISRDGRASALVGDLFPPSDSQLRGEGALPEPDSPFPSSAIRSDPMAADNRTGSDNAFALNLKINSLCIYPIIYYFRCSKYLPDQAF